MKDKVQKIREEVVRMHNLLPVMDGDNISVNYADRICTTLEMYIDTLQKEPVTDMDFEQELYKAFGQVKDFTLGMQIAKRFYEMGIQHQEPVSDDLEQAAIKYAQDKYMPVQTSQAFKAGANWQKQKDSIVSEELEKAEKEWLTPQLDKSYTNYGEGKMMELTHFDGYAMLDAIEFGAKWQKKKTLKESEDAIQYVRENHSPNEVSDFQNAMNIAVMKAFDAGKEKMKEEMMAKAIDGYVIEDIEEGNGDFLLSAEYLPKSMGLKDRQKVKVIVIKED